MSAQADPTAPQSRRRTPAVLARLYRWGVMLGPATIPISFAAIIGLLLYMPQAQELLRLELQKSRPWIWLYPAFILWALLLELSALLLMRFPYQRASRVAAWDMPLHKPAYLISWFSLALGTSATLAAVWPDLLLPAAWRFDEHLAVGLLILSAYAVFRGARSPLLARCRRAISRTVERIGHAVGSPRRAATRIAVGAGVAIVVLGAFPVRPALTLGTLYSLFLCSAFWLVCLTSLSIVWRLSTLGKLITLGKTALAVAFVGMLSAIAANLFAPSDQEWARTVGQEIVARVQRHAAAAEANGAERPVAQAYIAHWLQARQHSGSIAAGAKPYPVFLVAAAGGGLRGALWTALVLGRLEDAAPDFADHVLAMSGVSGGALGVAVFSALLHHAREQPTDPPCAAQAEHPTFQSCAQRILDKDFLAPVITEFMTYDALTAPFPFIQPRRGVALVDAWGTALKDALGTDPFAMPFDSLWADDRDLRQPALLIGSTHLETGSRVLASNLTIRWPPFYQALDRQGDGLERLTLGTAVLDSARFAYVAPAGRLVSPGIGTWGHVVDGGYTDDTGALAIDEMMKALGEYTSAAGITGQVMPFVLYISNDIDSVLSWKEVNLQVENLAPPARFYVQVRTPLLALTAARRAHIRITIDALEADADALCVTMQGLHLQLENVPVPRSWTLSPGAVTEIATEVQQDADITRLAGLMRQPAKPSPSPDPGRPACRQTGGRALP